MGGHRNSGTKQLPSCLKGPAQDDHLFLKRAELAARLEDDRVKDGAATCLVRVPALWAIALAC